ncbi:MAG: recombinase RecT [Litorimonas sp.]
MTDQSIIAKDPTAPVPASKLDLSLPVGNIGGGFLPQPKTAQDLMEMAQLMAKAGPMVGAPFRREPGACMAIIVQAGRLGMDPFALSSKAYLVNGSIAFEAQAIMAMVYASPAVDGRLAFEFSGEGDQTRVKVTGRVVGTLAPCTYESETLAVMKKGGNSPLWQKDPRQQMTYYAARAWARRHVPDVLMGVYSVDEMEGATARDVTPDRSDAGQRLQANLAKFEEDRAIASEAVEEVEAVEEADDEKTRRLAEAQAAMDDVLTGSEDPDAFRAELDDTHPSDEFNDDWTKAEGDTPQQDAA